MRRLLVFLLVGLVGCGLQTGADDVYGPELCWPSCPAGATCSDGVLTIRTGRTGPTEPYPCDEEPPFQCPVERTTCAAGCIAEDLAFESFGSISDTAVYAWLCRSAEPAAAGDACAVDADCTPTFAYPSPPGPGELSQEYLRCGAGGTCEEARPPVIGGFGDDCVPALDEPVFGPYWSENTTPGGLPACLFVGDGECRFATIRCDGDWQCPANSRCDLAMSRADGVDTTQGICRYGLDSLGSRTCPPSF